MLTSLFRSRCAHVSVAERSDSLRLYQHIESNRDCNFMQCLLCLHFVDILDYIRRHVPASLDENLGDMSHAVTSPWSAIGLRSVQLTCSFRSCLSYLSLPILPPQPLFSVQEHTSVSFLLQLSHYCTLKCRPMVMATRHMVNDDNSVGHARTTTLH